MSKYSIKRIDDSDPAALGKRRKRISYLFVIFACFLAILLIVLPPTIDLPVATTNLVLMSVIYGGAFIYYIKISKANRRIKDIGSIEFNRGGIVKFIGDIRTDYDYTSIESIGLKKHLPAATIKEGKKGYFTHILTITFLDRHIENIVVSDRPSGKYRDMSIVETLKTLRRFTQIQIEIN